MRKKRIWIVVSSLGQGGISHFVVNLESVLTNDYKIEIIVTHGGVKAEFKNKIKSKIVELQTSNKFVKYVQLYFQYLKFRPDIIIGNYNGTIKRLLPLISLKVRFIDVIHSIDERFYDIALIDKNRVNAWIAPSPLIASQFLSYAGKDVEDRIKLIPHGVRESNLQYHDRSEKIKLLFVGTLFYYKGVKLFPEILKHLDSEGIDWTFNIVGSGSDADWLKDNLSEFINTGKVTMFQDLSSDDVYKLMSESDIFLFPSELEAFGLVIAEAMMNGAVPVVRLIKGVTDFIVENGVCGMVVNGDSPKDYANAISEYYRNSNKLSCHRSNAESRAKRMFSLDCMGTDYKTIISRLLN